MVIYVNLDHVLSIRTCAFHLDHVFSIPAHAKSDIFYVRWYRENIVQTQTTPLILRRILRISEKTCADIGKMHSFSMCRFHTPLFFEENIMFWRRRKFGACFLEVNARKSSGRNRPTALYTTANTKKNYREEDQESGDVYWHFNIIIYLL